MARKWALAEAAKAAEARARALERDAERKQERRKQIREMNTVGPRLQQQLHDAREAKRMRELELLRAKKEGY